MSQDNYLRQFGERLVRLVRDRSISASDWRLAGGDPVGQRWAQLIPNDDARRAMAAIIPDIVDQVLFELLNAIDNDELPLAWRTTDGSFADLSELGAGEMAGWLMGKAPSWRHDFSTERISPEPD
jgi:hypothetical protein